MGIKIVTCKKEDIIYVRFRRKGWSRYSGETKIQRWLHRLIFRLNQGAGSQYLITQNI